MGAFQGQKVRIVILLWIAIFLLSIQIGESSSFKYPPNLWQGLIAEDTSGDYRVYLIIASVVRNRLNKDEWHGLNGFRRKDLLNFVAENYLYVLKTKGIDLEQISKRAIYEVFILNKDYASGATRYEHTKVYGIPKDLVGIRPIRVIYAETKREITLWK